jgi:protocatechuate 3,4-dioxygenase beta subunit
MGPILNKGRLMKNKILSRRELIRLGGLTMAAGIILPSCVPSSSTSSATGTTDTTGVGVTTGTSATGGTCGVIPSETAGPYPAHDEQGINSLTLTGIERSDIRASLNAGAYTGTAIATGLPLTLKIQLVDVTSGCTPLAGYAVYLWHCDKDGKYSMYSSGITSETYLRGVQETDANGWVTFQTIFPGCYDGRMTHMHFDIFPSVAQAIDNSYVVKTSQLSFPTATSSAIYNNVSGYSSSKTNFANISFATDNVFSDGTAYQIATVESGNVSSGFVSSLMVGV